MGSPCELCSLWSLVEPKCLHLLSYHPHPGHRARLQGGIFLQICSPLSHASPTLGTEYEPAPGAENRSQGRVGRGHPEALGGTASGIPSTGHNNMGLGCHVIFPRDPQKKTQDLVPPVASGPSSCLIITALALSPSPQNNHKRLFSSCCTICITSGPPPVI